MSKKQREKVEDEVRFHRAQMRAASETAPDSSVFEHQTPSSSDQHHSYNGGSVFFKNSIFFSIHFFIIIIIHPIYTHTINFFLINIHLQKFFVFFF